MSNLTKPQRARAHRIADKVFADIERTAFGKRANEGTPRTLDAEQRVWRSKSYEDAGLLITIEVTAERR